MGRAPYIDEKGVKKGAWSTEEDDILRAYIQRYGHWNWRELPKYAGLARCGKSCRLRWMNYLRPGVKRGNYTKDEEDLIIQLHRQLGNRWSVIATKLPGRTDNEIKNYWHTHLRKRLLQENPTFKGNKPKSTKNREIKEDHHQVTTMSTIDRNRAPKSTSIPILESSSSTEDLINTLNLDTLSSSARHNDDDDYSPTSFDSSYQYSWNTLDDLVDDKFWTEPFGVDYDFSDDFHLNFQNVPLSPTSMLCMENS